MPATSEEGPVIMGKTTMREMEMDYPMATLVPMVIEQTARGERAFDIYSRLLK